eukprot:15466437-Alexandrium_andersonii.AAC.1
MKVSPGLQARGSNVASVRTPRISNQASGTRYRVERVSNLSSNGEYNGQRARARRLRAVAGQADEDSNPWLGGQLRVHATARAIAIGHCDHHH